MNTTEGVNFKLITNADSNKLAIFLSGTYKNNSKFDIWRVAQLQNTNVLLLNNGKNDWYQNGIPDFGSTLEDTIARIKDIANTLNADEIYTIGVSMGAYGAILFGVHLDAKILAFGPDSLLKIPGSRSLKGMPQATEVRFPDLVPILEASPCKVALYAGEMDILDIYGASRIAHLPNVTAISVRGMDHGGGRYIDKTLGLPQFVSRFLADKPLPVMHEAGTILKEPGLANLLYASHCAGLQSNWDAAIDHAREAISMSPKCEAGHYLLATALLKTKKIAEAEKHFAFVAAYVPNFISGRFYLAHCLRLNGNLHAALHMYLIQAKEKPESAPTHFNIGVIHAALGNHKAAIASVKIAVALQPKKDAYKQKLKELRQANAKRAADQTANAPALV